MIIKWNLFLIDMLFTKIVTQPIALCLNAD